MPLLDAKTMRAVDRWAIEEQGIDGLDLMERAGAGVARAAERLAPDGDVTVVCGKGNNGGDGLVAARLLRQAGRAVTVVSTGPPQELTGDVRTNLDRLPGDRPVQLSGLEWAGASGDRGAVGGAPDADPFDGAAVVVDALLGTGFQGEPRDAIAEAIEAVCRADAPVVSVDVPSGVDASTGVVGGIAVRAATTVTFHAAKPGLWIAPGKAHAGVVEVLDIGIPRGAPADASIGLIGPLVLDLPPRRAVGWTKFTSGHVLVVGGSRGLIGAPRMAAHAAMRAGAGYVTACVPTSLQDVFASAGPAEAMTRGLPDDGEGLVAAALPGALEATGRGGALALGPGLGRGEATFAFARDLARQADVAMVLDADGLNAHAGRLAGLADRHAPTVLTPHAGELGRLLELESSEIERERLSHVRRAAALAGATVVLKGDDTLIADPGGRVAISPGDSPALATAGTGDVLTGVVAALLAQGLGAFEAAGAAVWLHAAAGREAARRQGGADGVIASDVIAALPAVRAGRAGGARDHRRVERGAGWEGAAGGEES
jgi:ADP-dependent NAD(P)H-hydrate dehydratase / NAD(P)H-hydrate epimerase